MTTPNSSDIATATAPTVVPQLPVTLDTKGRVRTSKEQRRIILAEFERSGVSAARFAQQTGLKYSTLAGWIQRCRRARRPRGIGSVRLLEALVEPAPAGSALLVHLPGGARIEMTRVEQAPVVVALLRALEKPC